MISLMDFPSKLELALLTTLMIAIQKEAKAIMPIQIITIEQLMMVDSSILEKAELRITKIMQVKME